MAENIGLGEAISGRTRLSGDWGAPISRGLQMAEVRDMKKLQLEQTKAYREQQAAEKMARHLTAKDGKFHNAKYQNEFGEFYKQALPKLMQAEKSGDVLTYSQTQIDINNELGRLKMLDADEHELNRAKLSGSVTAISAQDVYNKKGYQGLLEDNEIHVVPLANIDPKSGHFTLADIKDPMLSKKIDYNVAARLKTMADKKMVGSVNGVPLYKADPNSTEFKNMRTQVLNEILNDPAVLRAEMATPEFRKFYEDYHARTGMDYAEMKDPSMGLPRITEEYLNKKYDNALARSNQIKFAPNTSKSKETYDARFFVNGKNIGKFTFTGSPDGTVITDDFSKSGIVLKFKGDLSGSGSTKPVVQGIMNPELKYLGNDKFMVTGRPEGKGPSRRVSLVVDKSEVTSKYNLTDAGLEYYLGYTPTGEPASVKPKTEAPAAKAKTPAPQQNIPTITSKAEFDKLPVGATFIRNGIKYKKQ